MEPIEDWTQNQFVPFSPRHVMPVSVQQEVDLSLHFPYNIASQQAADFRYVGQCSTRQSNDELESIKNAIDMELQDFLSICVPTAISGNTSASCNAAVRDEDESSGDNVSDVDSTSDSELESDTEIHTEKDSPLRDTDFSTPYLMAGNDNFNARKKTSSLNLDSLCNQMNSTSKRVIVEDWIADDHRDNINNASASKKRKLKRDVSEKNSVNKSKPRSKSPSKSSDNMSKQVQFDQSDSNKDYASDSQSLCLGMQHPTASLESDHQSDDTQDEHQSANSQSARPHKKSWALREKNKKMKSISNMSVASRAKHWQVTNISQCCSLFEYKWTLLNQQIPDHYTSSFLRQVSLSSFSLLVLLG